ncbi:MAG: MliC family protein [Gammaproteobacteria bacterium]|nr:MliC family protein [Gammaproteobacteria bacterium]
MITWRRLPMLGLAVLSACTCVRLAELESNQPDTAPSEAPVQTFAYNCPDNYRFVARLESGNELRLFLPEQTARLIRVPSASGTRYRDAAGLVFWSKGEEALLVTDTVHHRQCRNDPALAVWEHARLNGVDFRAVGNEPGWHMEIREGVSIHLVTDYGQTSQLFPHPSRTDRHDTSPSTRYVARTDGQTLSVLLSPGSCTDSMSGQSYPVKVEVQFHDATLMGCGRPLR